MKADLERSKELTSSDFFQAYLLLAQKHGKQI
jgi:hypothetical protein